MTRRILVLALVAIALGAGPRAAQAPAQQCRDVAFIVTADAAPVAARLDQGTVVPIPVSYSHVEHETSPEYVYAEAGSTSLGPLEGVVLQPRQVTGLLGGMIPVPIDLPDIPDIPGAPAVPVPPGRAASTYPESSLPPVATGDWAIGRSRTEASQERASATSGVEAIGLGSRVESTMNCETLTVEAGWTLAGLTLPGGIVLGEISQTARIVIGPDGTPDVTVDTVLLDDSLGLADLLGQIPDEVIGEIFAAGGQEFAVGDPEVTVSEDEVRVLARPVAMRFVPPGGTQAVGASVGLIDVTVRRLGVVPSPPEFEPAPVPAPSPTSSPVAEPVGTTPRPGPTATPETTVLERSELEVAPVSSYMEPVDFVRSTARPWWPPFVAAVAIAVVFWRVADARRDRWPTADWTLRHLETMGRWFRATYLRW